MLHFLLPLFATAPSVAGITTLATSVLAIANRNRDYTFKITKKEAREILDLANTALLIDENIIKSGFDSEKICQIVSVKDLKESAKYVIEIKKSCDTVLEKDVLERFFERKKAFLCEPYEAKEFIRAFISECIKLFIFTLDSYSRNNIQKIVNIIKRNKFSKATLENILAKLNNDICNNEQKGSLQNESIDQLKELTCLLEELMTEEVIPEEIQKAIVPKEAVSLEDNKKEERTSSDSEEARSLENNVPVAEDKEQNEEPDDKARKDELMAKVDCLIPTPVKFDFLNEEFLRKVYYEFEKDLLAPEGQDHRTSLEAFLHYLGCEDYKTKEDAIYFHGDSAALICFVHHLIVEKDINIPKGKWQSLARVIMFPNKKNTEWRNPAYTSIQTGYTSKEDKPINLDLKRRFDEIKK